MRKIALFALALPMAAQDWRSALPSPDQIKLVQDHEVSLGKGESCDCPCHGGYGAEYQSKDRLRR